MAYSEDHIALAAEYALGTLDADERAQVETMMAVDKEYAAIVQAWEFRLGVLNQMVGSVEPRPMVWDNIRAAIGHGPPQAPLVLPDAPPPLVAANDVSEEVAAAAPVGSPSPQASNVVQLNSRARRWRNIATGMTAIAAALLVMMSMQIYQPDLLPDGIRPKPRTQVVEVKTPAPPAAAQYVALLQRDAGSPAFILTVDAATRNFTVRKVGATAGGRQELRALDRVGKTAAAALARRDRRQRFHGAAGAVGLRRRPRQRGDLCREP